MVKTSNIVCFASFWTPHALIGTSRLSVARCSSGVPQRQRTVLDHLLIATPAIAVVVVVALAPALALTAAVGAVAFVIRVVRVALGTVLVKVIAALVALRVDSKAVLVVVRSDGAVVAVKSPMSPMKKHCALTMLTG